MKQMKPGDIPDAQVDDWNKYITRVGEIIRKRHPDDAVITIIPHILEDGNAVVNIVSHHLEPAVLLPVIMHLSDMLYRQFPHVESVKAVNAAINLHFGRSETQDISAGKN